MASRSTDKPEIVPPHDGHLCKEAVEQALRSPDPDSFLKIFENDCRICRNALASLEAKKKNPQSQSPKKPKAVPSLDDEFLIFPMDPPGGETYSPPPKFTTITAKGEVKGKEKAGDKKTGIESLKNPPIDMSKILPVGSEDDKGNRIWWKHDSLCMCTVDDGVWFQRVYRRSPSPEPTENGKATREQTRESMRLWELHRSGGLAEDIEKRTNERIKEWLPERLWDKRL